VELSPLWGPVWAIVEYFVPAPFGHPNHFFGFWTDPKTDLQVFIEKIAFEF